MAEQTKLNVSEPVESVETYEFDPIQGYPMLNWKGKRSFRSTQYFPAQLKETYGEEVDGWTNKIYWGDNLQVMSHLLKTYRGKIDLIYIDPPFDSKADYKKQIALRGKKVENDRTAFEEKQYTDIWTNDEYLQFMYERLIMLRELLSEKASLYLHCDCHKNHHLRLILDEVFGKGNFVNEIIWKYKWASTVKKKFSQKHDTIFWYAKSAENWIFNLDEMREPYTEQQLNGYKKDEDGYYTLDSSGKKWYAHPKGQLPSDLFEIGIISRKAKERQKFPTQKPEALLDRIIKASSNPGDLVFDCFMGSGTTQAVAMKLGRRFIGADINLGAVETTTKRLARLATDIQEDNTYRLESGGGGSLLSTQVLRSITSITMMYFVTRLRRRIFSLKLWRFRSFLLVALMTVKKMVAWSRSCRSIASPPVQISTN